MIDRCKQFRPNLLRLISLQQTGIVFIIFISWSVFSGECDNWRALHPEWIFCDDFEDTTALVKQGRYFEYDDNNGDFVNVNGVGLDGSHGMRILWHSGEVSDGSLHLAFGRNPNNYMNKQGIRPTEDFREIYYRMYLKMQDGWQGSPAKLSRATVFASPDNWGQAMIAHLWSDDSAHLLLDPASCVANGAVQCTTFNDFAHLQWLGLKSGTTPLFSNANSGTWFCIEHHVSLNDPGKSNGVQEFWIDDKIEARRDSLDFVGTYTAYAINAVFFENYWNSGSPKDQERYFDNIVISTAKIGMIRNTAAKQPYYNSTRFYTNYQNMAVQPAAYYDIRGRRIARIRLHKGIAIGFASQGRKILLVKGL